MQIAEPWVEGPLRAFLDEARVDAAVLMYTSGQVLAQVGFRRSADVMTACALTAAIHSSSSELGRQLEGRPFHTLHYAGAERQVLVATLPTSRGDVLLLAVFGDESSLGIIQVFLPDLQRGLAAAAPPRESHGVALGLDFERDLNRNLAVLFGRGG